MHRLAHALPRFIFPFVLAATPVLAQAPRTQRRSADARKRVIASERADKLAELWPERQNAMVDRAQWCGRAWPQGGLRVRPWRQRRPGGAGRYAVRTGHERRPRVPPVGFFREQLGVRTHCARQACFRVPTRSTSTGGRVCGPTARSWYTRFEHSPHIGYLGAGNDSLKSNQASYRYDDFSSDF